LKYSMPPSDYNITIKNKVKIQMTI
jgi:hypothetical protein